MIAMPPAKNQHPAQSKKDMKKTPATREYIVECHSGSSQDGHSGSP